MRMTSRMLGIVAVSLVAGPVMAQDVPGEHFELRADDLPRPGATVNIANTPNIVPRPPDAALAVPPGFAATLFADGLDDAGDLAIAPNGDVVVTVGPRGRVLVLRDDGKGRSLPPEVFADRLDTPSGVAFHDGALYVADVRAVWRFPYPGGNIAANDAAAVQVTPKGALGTVDGHKARELAFAPDGKNFYVSVGSRSNIGEEAAPRASVVEFHADGAFSMLFAGGLRSPTGIGFRPGSDDLYLAVNERDGLGDDLVPDFFTRVQRGGFYGWPYSYIGQNPDPRLGGKHSELVATALVPDVLFRAHSSPATLVFYDGGQFPAEYRGDAFVAMHGSGNAQMPVGYDIARIRFRDGKPLGGYEIFATGYRIGGAATARVWGRPTGLAVAPDGSLLVADDVGGTIWRISYAGTPAGN